ncbi:MAG: metal-dependent transcriptional regulator [Lachnospiraceae bacterium]|nr:metal-dependent transcriptional regulator [Lachnospiraceae bacterium]
MVVSESRENYLETIFVLSQDKKQIRSIDIVNELEFSKPSVSRAIKGLRKEGFIEVDPSGYITLTDEGLAIAKSMYERHVLISDWLIYLGVDKKTAVQDACRIEHTMSEQSFNAIKNQIEEWKRSIGII